MGDRRMESESRDELTFSLHPEMLDEGSAEEKAGFGTIKVVADGHCLTEGFDGHAKSDREGPLASGYHLAEWLAWNWWRLRWEPPRPPAYRTLEWASAHRMSTIGEGYTWPNITIDSDGFRSVLISERSLQRNTEPFRYYGSPEAVVLPASCLESAIDRSRRTSWSFWGKQDLAIPTSTAFGRILESNGKTPRCHATAGWKLVSAATRTRQMQKRSSAASPMLPISAKTPWKKSPPAPSPVPRGRSTCCRQDGSRRSRSGRGSMRGPPTLFDWIPGRVSRNGEKSRLGVWARPPPAWFAIRESGHGADRQCSSCRTCRDDRSRNFRAYEGFRRDGLRPGPQRRRDTHGVPVQMGRQDAASSSLG